MEEHCCNVLLEQMFCSSVCEPVGPCKNYHRRARNIPVNKMSAFYEPYLRLLDQFFFLKFMSRLKLPLFFFKNETIVFF